MVASSSILLASWCYVLLVVLWFILHLYFGDRCWLLALLTPFAPIFLGPLFLQIGLALLLPTEMAWLGWLAIAPPLAIFTWLYGGYFCHLKRPSVNASPSFTLMTFNIWWQSQQRTTATVPLQVKAPLQVKSPRQADAKLADMPDIVAFQELLPHMAQTIAHETASHYPYRLFDVGETTVPGLAARRLGIISRFPLEPVNAAHLQSKDFRVQVARVHTPLRPILLYNIHPRATLIVRYLREGRPLGSKVAASFAQRQIYFEQLLADIQTRAEAKVVVGDFNSTDLSDVYKLMHRQLVDVHRAVGWGWGHTFPMHGADFGNLPVPRRLMRLDMIFCSSELLPLACRVARFHGESDHLPVMARLGWHHASFRSAHAQAS